MYDWHFVLYTTARDNSFELTGVKASTGINFYMWLWLSSRLQDVQVCTHRRGRR